MEGVSVPAAHASPVADDTTYGAAQLGAQLVPDSCVDPAPHVAEFATVGCVHAFASQIGAVPLYVPLTGHVYVAGVPTAVYPIAHTTLAVQLAPTTSAFPPHALVSTLTEFAIVSASAAVHWHTGATPLQVPRLPSQVYVAGVPLTVSPAEHVALTVHVAPPTTAAHALTV